MRDSNARAGAAAEQHQGVHRLVYELSHACADEARRVCHHAVSRSTDETARLIEPEDFHETQFKLIHCRS